MKSILDILDDMIVSGVEGIEYTVVCGCEDRGCCNCEL